MATNGQGGQRSADVVIAGGGMVGLTLACGLADYGLDVIVVDTQSPRAVLDAGFDGRCSAIAHASAQLLKAIGVWDYLEAEVQPILEIRVSDGPSLLHLHFDHEALGEGPLGYMAENRHIRRALQSRAGRLDNLEFLAPAHIETVDRSADGVRARLAGGEVIGAPVILAADGRESSQRGQAGIAIARWRYDQAAVVATVEHTLSHCGIAHERFLPAGPFAILPLTGDRSSLVWTTAAETAPAIMALGPRAFEEEVTARIGDFLGETRVIGPRWSYPLGLHMADRYVDRRLALVGDAAHGIHPIAGQGLNMGFRDVAALIEILVQAARLGLDLGSAAVLERYQRWRRVDNLTLAVVTDGLNRLFSNDLAPVRMARDAGLAAVNRIPPLKSFFMRHARGTVGKLPALLEGRRP